MRRLVILMSQEDAETNVKTAQKKPAGPNVDRFTIVTTICSLILAVISTTIVVINYVDRLNERRPQHFNPPVVVITRAVPVRYCPPVVRVKPKAIRTMKPKGSRSH